jgi:Mitochondrial and peroxisomal fission factor Mff
MKVSKHIKATGEYYEDDFLSNGNSYLPWNYHDKIEMNVPDRIVIGPHLGKRFLQITLNPCY